MQNAIIPTSIEGLREQMAEQRKLRRVLLLFSLAVLLVGQHYCFDFFFVISQFLVVVFPPLVVITPLEAKAL